MSPSANLHGDLPDGAAAHDDAWTLLRLTAGTDEGRFHSHSYYDIPVFDAGSRLVAAHRTSFTGRQPTPDDAVEVGVVDVGAPLEWRSVGTARAWSWQQGPMAQFVPGTSTLVWNDRDGDRFVARRRDLGDAGSGRGGGGRGGERGGTDGDATLSRPVYALSPDGAFALSLDMARLEALRPGYGYAGGAGARLDEPRPADDGVWRVPLDGGPPSLVLSLDDAVRFTLPHLPLVARLRHRLARHRYWFNHVKIAPDGRRFTVKLRWRTPGHGWNESQGVSLTCACDGGGGGGGGGGPSLLATATSHVIWEDAGTLYLWRDGGLERVADASPTGRPLGPLAPGVVDANVHVRKLPGEASRFVFDTPYRESIELNLYDEASNAVRRLASFTGHVPPRGPFRCDLHPCPSPDGRRVVVTSLVDGGRQLYLLTRDREPA